VGLAYEGASYLDRVRWVREEIAALFLKVSNSYGSLKALSSLAQRPQHAQVHVLPDRLVDYLHPSPWRAGARPPRHPDAEERAQLIDSPKALAGQRA